MANKYIIKQLTDEGLVTLYPQTTAEQIIESEDRVFVSPAQKQLIEDLEAGTGGVTSLGGATGAITVSSDLAVDGNQLKIVTDFVEAEAGKGLSTEDYTTAEKEKLEGIAAGAQVNILEGVTLNGEAVTITDKVADLTISVGVDLDYDTETGVLSLKDANDDVLDTVNLPLELFLQSGAYDENTKEIILTITNGNEIRIPVAELVNEYAADGTTITLDTTNNVNKFSIAAAVLNRITALETGTGVAAGVYSAVQVDTKGRVTAGRQSIEVGTAASNTASDDLVVGGLFFEYVG